MGKNDLFGWLSQYHFDANLRPNLDYIVDGQYLKARTAKPLEEGEENTQTHGVLILADGDNLVRRLKKEKIILDLSTPLFSPAENYDLFSGYISKNKTRDGAFVYDGKNGTITRISRYNNHSSPAMQEVRENYQHYMPANFIHEDAGVMTPEEYDLDVGTKTDLAMVLPVSHTKKDSSVHSYQIKATAHSPLGLGKVAHFGPEGLVEELFFKYEPSCEGLFLAPEQKIIGVHRQYQRGPDNKLHVASENVVGPSLEDYFKRF